MNGTRKIIPTSVCLEWLCEKTLAGHLNPFDFLFAEAMQHSQGRDRTTYLFHSSEQACHNSDIQPFDLWTEPVFLDLARNKQEHGSDHYLDLVHRSNHKFHLEDPSSPRCDYTYRLIEATQRIRLSKDRSIPLLTPFDFRIL